MGNAMFIENKLIMKINKLFLFVFGIAAVLSAEAFNLVKSEVKSLSHSDSVKTKQLTKAPEVPAVSPVNNPTVAGKLFDQPVEDKYVVPCIAAFQKKRLVKGVVLTESVEFSRADLTKWLDTLPDQTDYTHLRVYMGLYTKEFLAHYKVPNPHRLLNRLTVFLVPFNNGVKAIYKPGKGHHPGDPVDSTAVDSFNLGNVHP